MGLINSIDFFGQLENFDASLIISYIISNHSHQVHAYYEKNRKNPRKVYTL
jgi:hypothetical protein